MEIRFEKSSLSAVTDQSYRAAYIDCDVEFSRNPRRYQDILEKSQLDRSQFNICAEGEGGALPHTKLPP